MRYLIVSLQASTIRKLSNGAIFIEKIAEIGKTTSTGQCGPGAPLGGQGSGDEEQGMGGLCRGLVFAARGQGQGVARPITLARARGAMFFEFTTCPVT